MTRKTLVLAGLAAALGAAAIGYRAWQAPAGEAARAPQSTAPSVAVLPFASRGDNPRGVYYGQGVSEELRRALARVEGLRVTGTDAPSADARRIGLTLNVSSVLQGEVEVDGNRLRISATLVDVADGRPLWSQTFERDIEQVFALQEEISRAIAAALELDGGRTALVEAATDSVEAYDYYLVGRHHWQQRTPQSLQRSVEMFEKAIELDESYALAYSGLADAYLLLKSYGTAPADVADARAQAAIDTALRLNDRLAEGYASLGLMKLGTGELDAAQSAFAHAIELNPDYAMAHMWLGNIHHARGDGEGAHRAYLAASRIVPLHPTININLATTLGERGEVAQAIARLEQVLETHPDSAAVLRALGDWNRELGRYEQAWRSARRAVELDGGSPLSLLTLAGVYLEVGEFGAAAHWLGRAGETIPAHTPLEGMLVELGARLRMYRGEAAELQRFAEAQLEQAGPAPDGGTPPADKAAYARLGWAGIAAVLNGQPRLAVERLERLRALAGAAQEDKNLAWAYALLADAHRRLGDAARATELLDAAETQLDRRRAQGWKIAGMDVDEAALMAARGEVDAAMAALQRAVGAGWRGYWTLQRDPRFAALRADPRFAALAGQMRREIDDARARIAAAESAGGGRA